jgi:S-adenosylmethionine-dependent methyltransferase
MLNDFLLFVQHQVRLKSTQFKAARIFLNVYFIGGHLASIPSFVPSGLTAKQATRKFSGQDRNFDGLAERFKRNIYGGLKGDIRIAVLQRDLGEHVLLSDPDKPLRILDAGGGQGQFSLGLAAMGHHVTICDISSDMLALAADEVLKQGLEERVEIRHESIQSLAEKAALTTLAPYDLVLCHAVMEWVIEPETLLHTLTYLVAPGGHLSLTFYNENGVMMKQLLRGNLQRVLQKDYSGYPGSLTPTQPLSPEQVTQWLARLPLTILCKSGIRCFHDYILDPVTREHSPQATIELELKLSRQEPFLSLARYIHILGRRLTL